MASDGIPDFLKIPAFLTQHPELQRRNIHLIKTLRPGTVFATDWHKPPQYVVKIMDPSNDEADILDGLQGDLTCPASHVVPCEVIRSDQLLAIMPWLPATGVCLFRSNVGSALDAFDQLLEGIGHLHDRGIAHMDLCDANVLAASSRAASSDPRLKSGKLYIIDFDRSRKLDLRPGAQGAVALPETVCRPPPGVTHLDPYSWDVYCAGRLLLRYLRRSIGNKPSPHIVDIYAQWLIGDERGCTGACRCRPTARQARRALTMVRLAIIVFECCESVFSVMRTPSGGRHSSQDDDFF